MEHESEIRELHEKRQQCKTCKKIDDEVEQCWYPIFEYKTMEVLRVLSDRCEKQKYHYRLKRIEELFGTSGIGKRFQNRRFETFKITDKNKPAYEKCKKYCENFPYEDGHGLLIIGDYGTGKTHLAVSILHSILEKDVSSLFVLVPELLMKIRSSFDDKTDSNQLIRKIKKVSFLVFDDLGAEKTTDWVREQLFMIINSRYEDMLPTVITSNLPLKELEDKIGPRTVSRLIEMCEGVMLGGEDYRKQKLR